MLVTKTDFEREGQRVMNVQTIERERASMSGKDDRLSRCEGKERDIWL